MEQILCGLRCRSGLGKKSLISIVDETLGFWQRESKLLEADDARRLRSARRDENEFSDVTLGLLFGLCKSSFSIGV